MDVWITYQHAQRGNVSLYFYRDGQLQYWFQFIMNERLKLLQLFNDLGVTGITLYQLTDSDARMLDYLKTHFALEYRSA